MIGLLKAIASIVGGVMDVIIGIAKALDNDIFKIIIILLTSPIYFPALGVYFVCVGLADQVKRGSGEGNFYEEKEGLKSFEYYISFGIEKSD